MLMTEKLSDQLKLVEIVPYIALSTMSICLPRRVGGNMFRHQAMTWIILIDYGYTDAVLLKAALVHDLIEDLSLTSPPFDPHLIASADEDGPEVLNLVIEVTRKTTETKEEYLGRILNEGSEKACLIKACDRISNLIDCGFNKDSLARLCDESEAFVLPIAARVDSNMCREIQDLICSRRKLMSTWENSLEKR
jgi:GTP pyrophosphokinase